MIYRTTRSRLEDGGPIEKEILRRIEEAEHRDFVFFTYRMSGYQRCVNEDGSFYWRAAPYPDADWTAEVTYIL